MVHTTGITVLLYTSLLRAFSVSPAITISSTPEFFLKELDTYEQTEEQTGICS